MTTTVQIVIIGASLAGSTLKNEILKYAKKFKIFITVIEKQEEINWVIGGTRSIVDKEYANKYHFSLDKYFPDGNLGKIVHGRVEKIEGKLVKLVDGSEIPFDYLIIASGSRYTSPVPFNLQFESKSESINTLEKSAEIIKGSKAICVIGGGPIGVETAAEIKELYPDKDITLIHSGSHLLGGNKLKESFLKHTHKVLESLGIKVVLGERANLDNIPPFDASVPHTVTTISGKSFQSDLTLNCIGASSPNTEFVTPEWLDPLSKKINVNSFLQVTGTFNIFSLGNAANTVADPRVMPIRDQASIVAFNISAQIQSKPLKEYKYKEANLMILALGRKTGLGTLPFWLPQGMTDGMSKAIKSKDLFGSMNGKALYNLVIKK